MDHQKLRTELKEIVATAESVPEKYKEKCFEILFNRLMDAFQVGPAEKPKQIGDSLPKSAKKPPTSNYENVIATEGDLVTVIQSPPGNTVADKNVNAALLYLFGKELLDQNEATFSEVRNVCKEHGCLDPTNFSKNIKRAKKYFIFSGTGPSQTIKLTVPGRNKAGSLVAELNNK